MLTAAFEEQRRAGRRVRAVVLCTPNNPTGACLSVGESKALCKCLEAELVRGEDFVVLLDEVYVFFVVLLSVAPTNFFQRVLFYTHIAPTRVAKLVVSSCQIEQTTGGFRCAYMHIVLLASYPSIVRYLGIERAKHVSILQHATALLARRLCLVLSGSKGLGAMPGARVAWVTCMSAGMIEAMAKTQCNLSAGEPSNSPCV
jgi:aspartate/methionine/tyrosine aminotransferase